MQHALKMLLFTILSLMVFSGSACAYSSKEAAVQKTLTSFLTAMKDKNADAMGKVLSKDFAYYMYRTKINKSYSFDRERLMNWVRQTPEKYSTLEASDQRMEFIGASGRIAIVQANLLAQWRKEESQSAASFVFVNNDGVWQLLSYATDQVIDTY